MKQVWLISYAHPGGFGRFVNTRQDNKRPSFDDIESMERKICEQNKFRNGTVCVLSVSRLQDEE